MKKEITLTILAFGVTYLLQFIVLPPMLPDYYPSSNNAMVIYFLCHICLCFVLELVITRKFRYWLLGSFVYMLLMIAYHGKGLYAIGLAGIIDKYYDFSYALICVVFFEIYFVVIALLCKLFCYVTRRLKNGKNHQSLRELL